MKKILAIGLVLCGFCVFSSNNSYGYTIKKITNSPSYTATTDNAYSNDLTHIENILFGKNYRSETIENRLNRIEKKLFNKTYTKMSTADRMNNILSNCKTKTSRATYDDYITTTPTGSGSYYTKSGNFTTYSPTRRLYNRFIGQPTGFTPPIMNSPFHRNSFRPGFRSYHRPYNNQYRNSYYRPRINNTYGTRTYYGTPSYLQPTSARAGITILP